MQVPVINQEAKILSSYLNSYQFAQKQRVSLANHLDSIQDKDLSKLLKQELKRAQIPCLPYSLIIKVQTGRR